MTASRTNFSQLRDFLAYLATVKCDLSNITAPPSVLAPTSVTEIPASWASRRELFLAPAYEADAARRALLVLKNFLCSLKPQLATAADASGAPRKPLNPFLGELFIGEFTGGGGGRSRGSSSSSSNGGDSSSSSSSSSKVSHHPPVTACAAYNLEAGVSSSGYVAQSTTFGPLSGVRVRQTGHALIRDARHGESHLRTLPAMAVRGLLTGAAYPELEGVCYVVSSSGFVSTVEFTGARRRRRGAWRWAAGARNGVRATLARARDGGAGVGERLFEVTGQWSGRLTVRACDTGAVVEEFDVDDVAAGEMALRPLAEQSPWESRRAWRGVAEGIRAGDMECVRVEKGEIEEAQRQMRRAEARAGAEWPAAFFRAAAECPEFELLARAIPDPAAREIALDKTAGAWEFVGSGAAEALISEGVYHQGLEPTGWTRVSG
ncbi:Oxysterol-binding protein [Xylaria palmicola]|nr:Oxysterol-binding protein [Xylaria palmicola]